jgi:predicted RecA/RadA family phage recombinase
VVLWGNFIARVSNYAAGAYVPGSPVTAKNGVIALATAGTDNTIGYVLDVVAASSSTTANLVIKVI